MSIFPSAKTGAFASAPSASSAAVAVTCPVEHVSIKSHHTEFNVQAGQLVLIRSHYSRCCRCAGHCRGRKVSTFMESLLLAGHQMGKIENCNSRAESRCLMAGLNRAPWRYSSVADHLQVIVLTACSDLCIELARARRALVAVL
jgi:hypothetical protein